MKKDLVIAVIAFVLMIGGLFTKCAMGKEVIEPLPSPTVTPVPTYTPTPWPKYEDTIKKNETQQSMPSIKTVTPLPKGEILVDVN